MVAKVLFLVLIISVPEIAAYECTVPPPPGAGERLVVEKVVSAKI